MSRTHLLAIVLAVLGAVSIVIGVAMVYVPASFAIAGSLAIVGAYVMAWMESQA